MYYFLGLFMNSYPEHLEATSYIFYRLFNSFSAIGYLGGALACYIFAPQNITKHALSVILALYTLITDAGIKLSSRVIC